MKLKPCPWCKSLARLVDKYARSYEPKKIWFVECSNDNCAVVGPTSRVSAEEAEQKWNGGDICTQKEQFK